jgi:K+-sensing histidine kinase KdpD
LLHPITENSVTVFVKDTGIGIPEDKYYLIFQRFRQIDENQYHEGAGLGLSIAKGIIELLAVLSGSNPRGIRELHFISLTPVILSGELI